MIDRPADAGINWATLRLDVGLATFAPIRTESVDDHPMHEEQYSLPSATVESIKRARLDGGRVVAVGTTVVRVLETCATTSAAPAPALAGRGCSSVPDIAFASSRD